MTTMWTLCGVEEEKWAGEVPENKSIEDTLECDYEKDCTNLYRNVEEENWPAVSIFLETGYWPGSFFADGSNPAEQARTWVTRFEDKEKSIIRWSQLPLHLAIVVEAPYQVVGSLVDLYPQAVRCTDDQHMLPLHLAMRHGASDAVVDLLLGAFPEAVSAKGKNDRTPIDFALRGPNKARARILGIFVERAKAKATQTVSIGYSSEVARLRSNLEEKEKELEAVKSKLTALDDAKVALEGDLCSKISDITPNATVEEQEEIKNKIAQIEQEKADLQRAQDRAREESMVLIEKLEQVYSQEANTESPENVIIRHSSRLKKTSSETGRTEAGEETAEEKADSEAPETSPKLTQPTMEQPQVSDKPEVVESEKPEVVESEKPEVVESEVVESEKSAGETNQPKSLPRFAPKALPTGVKPKSSCCVIL